MNPAWKKAGWLPPYWPNQGGGGTADGVVLHGDFEDVSQLATSATLGQTTEKVCEVIGKLKGAIALALLIPFASYGAIGPGTMFRDVPPYTPISNLVNAASGGNPRSQLDLRVYRKMNDCWVWSNWANPMEPDAKPAPADFLAFANSPGSTPIYFKNDGWFGGTQFWPNGKRKYMKDPGPGGLGKETDLNFAFTAYDETGTNELFRFGAHAHRDDPTNETFVSWSDKPVNEFVRIATTDMVEWRISNATNAVRRVDGMARTLPKYLWRYDSFDSYEKDAYWYYDQEDAAFSLRPGLCSARRADRILERNYDWYRDDSAEFVVLTEPGPDRFASAGVASVGENLTEEFVTSGAPSRFYKCLPGRTVDGVNEKGVAIEVNVVVTNGSPWETHVDGDGRDIDSRWAVRWVLDHADNAGWAASNLADRVYISKALMRKGYSVHYAIVDRDGTWLVEDGKAIVRPSNWPLVVTNFRLDTQPSRIRANDPYGAGYERWEMLSDYSVSITNAWYSNAYRRNAFGDFPWPTEFAGSVDVDGPISNVETNRLQAWAKASIPPAVPDVAFPRGAGLWQTVHTSVYDISNRTLRIAVQEVDDWYVFQVPPAEGVKPDEVKEIVDPMIGAVMTELAGKLSKTEAAESYRRLGDHNIYRTIGFTDFTWSSDRQDIVDAMNAYGAQPYIHDDGDGYSYFDISFPYDDRRYYGDTYASSDTLEIGFTVYCDWWDPETEEYGWDEAYVTGTRESYGFDRDDPVDKYAKNSDLVSASARITTLESSVLGGEVKILRTGEDWQFGSGWGFLTRSVASDYRKWRIRVPKATYSGMSGSLSYATSYVVATSGVSKTGKNISMPLYGIGTGRLKYSHKLVHTEGTRGTDAVQLADYEIGLISESTAAAAGYYINMSLKHVSASPMVYYVTIDPTGWTLNGDGTMTREVSFPKVTLGNVTESGHSTYTTLIPEGASSEILKITIPTGPLQFTNTVSISYDLTDRIKHFNSVSTYGPWTRQPDVDDIARHTGTISVAFSASQLENQYIKSSRVVTSDTNGLFYDAGQDCTYRIDVTNGCFFTEWYMDGDWRKEPAQ